jgi:hypothetical protein
MASAWRGAVAVGVAGVVLPLTLLAACSTDEEAAPSDRESTPSSAPTRRAASTAELDAIVVLGHSGATGTMSDPANPARDAEENSWATGDNPEVRSIYLRLLETHPALEGHNYNGAVNGSTVGTLAQQFDAVLQEAEVVPDLVLIQTIDNDMRCDGTDAASYRPFARALDEQLTAISARAPDVQFFLTSQWATVEAWTRWASRHEGKVLDNAGSGPCDVFDDAGRPRPAGMRSMQRIVDAYWARLERVCAAHRGCFTDGYAQQRDFVPTDRDLSIDLDHLSVAGHAKFAGIAWRALPAAIKDRP